MHLLNYPILFNTHNKIVLVKLTDMNKHLTIQISYNGACSRAGSLITLMALLCYLFGYVYSGQKHT